MSKISFSDAAKYGFVFPAARAWIDRNNMAKLAQDAALISSPNSTVPAELLAYIDPQVVEIMTAPLRAREIFEEQKKGDWTTPYAKWRTDEYTGSTTAYSDYGDGGASGVNSQWLTRQQYLYQTTIQYGDLEVAMSSAAKINLASGKQRAAANILDIDANKFYLLGVRGKEICGILNDPNLPAAITASSVMINGTSVYSTKWADKSTTQVYNDVLGLFGELVRNSNGLITKDSKLKLELSPDLSVQLGSATDYNISVIDMLNKYFKNLEIVQLPELKSELSGETMFMTAPEVFGQATGSLAFGEKMRAGRLVSGLSSFSQKFTAGTYGGLVLMPFAFAQMTGM